MGGHVAADGYSTPYLWAMALGTALYGFLALWISFRLARKYVPERWAFLATLGIWFASSLPVYMYFNPSWSHAHSAFTVALFVWYWDRTRNGRTLGRNGSCWVRSAGLMMDVYYPNAVLLLFPLLESLHGLLVRPGSGRRASPSAAAASRTTRSFSAAPSSHFSPR